MDAAGVALLDELNDALHAPPPPNPTNAAQQQNSPAATKAAAAAAAAKKKIPATVADVENAVKKLVPMVHDSIMGSIEKMIESKVASILNEQNASIVALADVLDGMYEAQNAAREELERMSLEDSPAENIPAENAEAVEQPPAVVPPRAPLRPALDLTIRPMGQQQPKPRAFINRSFGNYKMSPRFAAHNNDAAGPSTVAVRKGGFHNNHQCRCHQCRRNFRFRNWHHDHNGHAH